MATIYDVAELAGVSPATVSRVFNGTSVSDEKVAAVRAAAATLDFTPNRAARSLRRQSSEVIALVIPDIENPYFTEMARGVEDVASEAGYSVVLCNSDAQVEKEATYLRIAIAENMSGVIIATADEHSDLDGILATGRPVVAVDRSTAYDIDGVTMANRAAGTSATRSLIDAGHRRIAYIGGPAHIDTAAERAAGWRSALAAAHPDLDLDELFPERLDKLVLASVEGLDQTVKMPAQTQLYLTRLQQRIALDPALQARFPDIAALMQQVLTQLDKTPLLLSLKQADGSSRDFLFQRLHLQLLTSMSLADPNQRIGRLLQLYQGLKAQPEAMKPVLAEILGTGMLDGFMAGPIELQMMSLMMDVASGISPARLQQFNQQQPSALLGGMLNFPVPQLSNIVPGLDLGDAFRQEASHAIPTLVLSGTLDGRTYLAEQQQAVAGLTARQQVTVQYGGHNLLESSPEVLAVIQQFIHSGKVSQQQIELPVPDLGL